MLGRTVARGSPGWSLCLALLGALCGSLLERKSLGGTLGCWVSVLLDAFLTVCLSETDVLTWATSFIEQDENGTPVTSSICSSWVCVPVW